MQAFFQCHHYNWKLSRKKRRSRVRIPPGTRLEALMKAAPWLLQRFRLRCRVRIYLLSGSLFFLVNINKFSIGNGSLYNLFLLPQSRFQLHIDGHLLLAKLIDLAGFIRNSGISFLPSLFSLLLLREGMLLLPSGFSGRPAVPMGNGLWRDRFRRSVGEGEQPSGL